MYNLSYLLIIFDIKLVRKYDFSTLIGSVKIQRNGWVGFK